MAVTDLRYMTAAAIRTAPAVDSAGKLLERPSDKAMPYAPGAMDRLGEEGLLATLDDLDDADLPPDFADY